MSTRLAITPFLRNSSILAFQRATFKPTRSLATATIPSKKEGDISNAFASLSGLEFSPLDSRFANVKRNLIAGREEALQESWVRLLASLRQEVSTVTALGSKAIPEIDFSDLDHASDQFRAEHKKRGVAVVRNVVPEDEVLGWKQQLREYIAANPHTKAFPPENPQIYELYWSKAQIAARAHPNLLRAQQFLLQFWHSKDPNASISIDHPISYADRLRMRLPGDAKFALGPHVDGGSCERWEAEGYGRGKVYDAIWNGRWEEYDPWEASCRLPVKADLYNGVGACSMFRMFQGWLSMSETGPFEGTLLVNPLLAKATAYFLLRPFFSPKRAAQESSGVDTYDTAFLDADNWQLDLSPSNSWLHGATPGHGQELRPFLHPHLDLPNTMVHMPKVRPGDYVSWHCDTIHSVDKVHMGKSDSSVLYIPACPLTEVNAEYLARQRQALLDGTPGLDFGGGKGESEHIGRATVDDVRHTNPSEGMRAFGLLDWDASAPGLSEGQKKMMLKANQILGFRG